MLDLKRHLEVVVVLKWQYVMSNFCRLSEVLVLIIYLVTTCAEGTYLHSVPSPFVKTYDFIFVNKPKNRTEVNLSSKLQKLGFPIVTLFSPFKKLAVLYYQSYFYPDNTRLRVF